MLELNDYPSDLESCITLPNQQRLRIRPLHPDEDGPVRELDAHLSTRTRYLRFLSPLPSLPDSLLRLLVSVDYQRRVTLIAESDARDRHEVVAMGSFGAIGESTAEVALVVRDDWQHQGVGTALAGRVLQAAEHRGFERFVVHVLSENTVIRRLLKRVGRVMSSTTRMGLSEVTFIARPAAPPSGVARDRDG